MTSILLLGGCGYIGSALRLHLDAVNADVTSVDLELRGNPLGRANLKADYRDLDANFISGFDCIVMLAAHSSVAQAIDDPSGAITNNIAAYWGLLQKLSTHQKFIYASSGSVYDGFSDSYPDEQSPVSNPRNMYDLSKMAGDFMAAFSGCQYYGLRFGTVSGVSPNLRAELIINKMTDDAVRTGTITLANPNVHRPCIGINDVCRIIMSIVESQDDLRGIYNACSFSATVEEYALNIAKRTGAQIDRRPDTPAYDFSMSTKLITSTFSFEFVDTVESVVDELILHFEASS